MGNAENTPRAPGKREASTKKQRDWKGWLKREGSQLGSIWVRWWIALMMVGVIDLAFGIVRALAFPWGWWEYVLVSFLTAAIALVEWLLVLAFRLPKWAWKKKASP